MIEGRGRIIVERTNEKVINIFSTKLVQTKKLYSVKLYYP